MSSPKDRPVEPGFAEIDWPPEPYRWQHVPSSLDMLTDGAIAYLIESEEKSE